MKSFLAFVTGLGIGVIAGYYISKSYHEDIANEEIESVKKEFRKAREEVSSIKEDKNSEDVVYNKISESYVTSSSVKDEPIEAEERPRDTYKLSPYIVNVDDYESNLIYEKTTLFVYGDDAVTDEGGDPIDNVDYVIGLDNIKNMQLDETIYIRNENLGTDFEVIKEGDVVPESFEDY